ncbi:hypothetical protein B0H13DRAFT_1894427 [Mycena leptocephala]|nr:hypothetical protein B0H13DRAFT_1894427 [Mycena leptocephala]
MEDLRHLMGQVRQISVQVREIKTKRREPRLNRLRAPKTVQVRQDEVQVRHKPKSSESSDLSWSSDEPLNFYPLLPPSSCPAPCAHSDRFCTAMDESQFSSPFWDGSSEAEQRQRVHSTSAPAAGIIPSFPFPATRHRFYLLSGFFSAPNSWDSGLFSLLPQAPQQMSTQWGDPAVQPHWDDFVSRLQPAQGRPPSTDSSAGIFPVMDTGKISI